MLNFLIALAGGILGLLLILFLVYLYLIMPSRSRRSEILRFAEHKYAHRGIFGGNVAENSMTAFRIAKEKGYGIELDVRLSRDGVPMVFHDGELKRMTGEEGKLSDYDSSELKNMRLAGTEDGIPMFSEVLDLIDGSVPLLIELKEEAGSYAVTEKTLELLENYKGGYIIESFNPLSLKLIRKKRPEVLRGFLALNYMKEGKHTGILYFLLQCLVFNVASRPDFISYEHKGYKSLPLRLCRSVFGAVSFAWTITSLEEEKAAYEHKFDTVIFENYLHGEEKE